MSPAINRGDSQSAFSMEPLPNGGYVDLGAYGNTSQASKSPVEYVTVTVPRGGERWPAERSFSVQWRSHDTSGTVDIDLLRLDGESLVVAESLATDSPNDGSFTWDIPADFAAGQYRVRVTKHGTQQFGLGDGLLTITVPVRAYYVNIPDDSDASDNEYTTASGSAGNDGLSPATPVDSLQTLLSKSIPFRAGDLVFIDAGHYDSSSNIVLTAAQSGVILQGPLDPTHKAVLDRGNTADGSYVFELMDADQVTISHLFVTGGYAGIFMGPDADNDDVLITSNEITGNYDRGVVVSTSNDRVRIEDNLLHDNRSGPFSIAIHVTAPGTLVSGNRLYAEHVAIDATGEIDQPQIRVVGNTVLDGLSAGIQVSANVLVEGNEVRGFDEYQFGTGIVVSNFATARNNLVHHNAVGILVESGGGVDGNRVYANEIGIIGRNDGLIENNRVYSNNIGIQAGGYAIEVSSRKVLNNLVYDNRSIGIDIQGANPSFYFSRGFRVENNTIHQQGGDAIRVQANSLNVVLRNNVVVIEDGTAIYVDPDSQVNFDSDFNIIRVGTNGAVGHWNNSPFADLSSWQVDIGQDKHSSSSDPLFIDPDGADNYLGYTANPVGPVVTLIPGDVGFNVQGDWQIVTPQGGDFVQSAGSFSEDVATWRLDGFAVLADEFYHIDFSASWPSFPGAGFASFDISVIGDGFELFADSSQSISLNQSESSTGDGFMEFTAPVTGTVSIVVSLSPNSGSNPIGDVVTIDGVTIDNGDPGFSAGPTWEPETSLAYSNETDGNDFATWTFTGLTAGFDYGVAADWPYFANGQFSAPYEITDGDQVLSRLQLNQEVRPEAGFNLGIVRATSDRLVVRIPSSVLAGTMSLTPLGRDSAADDDFRLATSSPTIDRGDPQTYYLSEPSPSGDRANLGSDGNSPRATTGPSQQVQLLSPDGGERWEVGQVVQVKWQSQGMSLRRPVARINVGGVSVGDWLQNAYWESPSASQELTEPVDQSAVDASAPSEVYQTYDEAARIGYQLPVPDGQYEIRLHFVEPWLEQSGERLFDILLQDELRATILMSLRKLEVG